MSVDVLATYDVAYGVATGLTILEPGQEERFLEARKIVAELADAARAVDANGWKRTHDPREGDYYRVSREDFDRLRAALANLGGEPV